jgi:hypothetical protein
LPVSATQKTGKELVSVFEITGVSACSGSCVSTWLTFACTSLKAISISFCSSKDGVMTDWPGDDVDTR